MQSVVHKAETRGHATHGWLESYHTFSFANYYDQERMGFGVLRVLNDDIIDGGSGFGMHPHENMEIITIPLEGNLAHTDSMENAAVIAQGDVQVMSAGTGITHSEYNNDSVGRVKLLQIWVLPNVMDIEPRYDQCSLMSEDRHNKLQQIVSPSPTDKGVWIHQNAWFHLGKFDAGVSTEYQFKMKGNGLYIFVISGVVRVGEQELDARDGYGVWDVASAGVTAVTPAEFLLMEVPMEA